MAKITISNIGTKGLNTDLSPWELPPEFLTYGKNFRVSGNYIEATNAYDVWATPPAPFNAGHLLPVEVKSGSFWIVPGRAAVWVYNGSTWSDITSTAGYGGLGVDDELKYTSAMLGSIPILNNPQHYPEYWSPQSPATKLKPLNFSAGNTWSDVNKSFKIIRSHNNFLFALNLVEGGVELPNSYRWSHPADTNGLPFSWDESDLSTIASIEQILGDAGAIVDGLTLRNSFCIYSERGINILDFVGGEFVFQNRELSSTYGLLNRNCITEVNGTHYFISDNGDIMKNNGNSITSIAYNRIRKRLNSQLNTQYLNRSYVTFNKLTKEIFFCVPEGSSTYPNTVYIYNFDDDTWAIKSLLTTVAYMGYGGVSVAPTTWGNVTGAWNNTNLNWATAGSSPLDRTLMAVDAVTSNLLLIDPTNASTTIDVDARIERTDLALEGVDNVSTLTRIYPHMEGISDVSIQVGSQQYPGAPVVWKPAQIFNPSTDRKLDIRTTGELHAWRINTIGTGTFKISGMTVEYERAGMR